MKRYALRVLIALVIITAFAYREDIALTIDYAAARMKDGQGRDIYSRYDGHRLSDHWPWLCRKREKEEEKRQNEMAKAQAAQAASRVATHQQPMAPASPRASAQRPIKGDYSNRPLIGSYSIDNVTTEIVILPGGTTGASIVRDGSGMLSVRLVFGSANDAKWWLYEGRYRSELSFQAILARALSSNIGTFVPISW